PVLVHFLKQADIIIPTSQPYLESSPLLAPVKQRCEVVPLGIEPEAFQHPDPALVSRIRQEHGGNFVLFSGMHRYYKGLRHLVDAAPRIHARVVMAGDGPERAEMMERAKAAGVDIAFPGRLTQEELVAHLHACAVFAFPYVERSEAF